MTTTARSAQTIDITIAAYNLGDLNGDAAELESYRAGVEAAVEARWPDATVTVEIVEPRHATEDDCDARGFEDGDEVAEVESACLGIAQDVWSDPAAWAPIPDAA